MPDSQKDFECQSLMKSDNLVVLKPEDTIEHAIKEMMKLRIRCLPVVNQDGKFLGDLTRERIISLLLPHSATSQWLDGKTHFMRESLEDLTTRFKKKLINLSKNIWIKRLILSRQNLL